MTYSIIGYSKLFQICFQILKSKVSLLEASNAELRRELQGRQVTCEHLAQCALDAQVPVSLFSLFHSNFSSN